VTKRTTIGGGGEGSGKLNPEGQAPSERFIWEDASFEDAHHAFTRWIDHVQERPSSIDRRKRNLLYASLYSNLPLLGFGVNSYTRTIAHQGRISLNALQNAIDSLTSKVCKNRPRPMWQTVEGDYELIEKAENADKWCDGRYHQLGYYHTIFPGKVLDCNIYGLGATKIHSVDLGEGLEPVVERRYPWEIIVDDRECMYGRPWRIAERRYFDKQEAFDLYKKDKAGKEAKEWNLDLERVIQSRATWTDRVDFDRDESSEQVVIYEGYSRRTSRRPGKKIIALRGKTLDYAGFNEPDVPYNLLRPEVQMMGFYGIGCCERAAGVQGEINRIVRDVQMAMHLIAKPHWMVESSSNVNSTSLNNDIATIIKYSGTRPEVYTPQSMSGEVFQHLQYLVKSLYEMLGISQLSAQSQKPAGLNAAVAMRTYLDTETVRFSNLIRNVEESASEDAWKLAKEAARIGWKKQVLSRGASKGRLLDRVTWDKVDFDTMSVQVTPGSKLPDTPAGQREFALEMAQYTQVTTDDIFEMLELGETEPFARRRLAGKKNVERDIMKIRRGEKVVRDAIGDHQMAYKMMLDAYEEAKHDGIPEKRLRVMRDYIKATYRFLTGKAWMPAGPNPLPGSPMPAGPPGMPPPGAPPPMGGPSPMLPPGAPPMPMAPMPNGGANPQPPM
jgi:hypothetical protein